MKGKYLLFWEMLNDKIRRLITKVFKMWNSNQTKNTQNNNSYYCFVSKYHIPTSCYMNY